MKTWNQISKKLEKKLSQDEFNTWIRPLQGEFKENSLEIIAPNDFVLNYVSNNLKNHIYEVLASKDTKIIFKDKNNSTFVDKYVENPSNTRKSYPGLVQSFVFDMVSENTEFTILGSVLRNLISKTSFAMGNQDWRHYLNGMYLNIEDKNITVVTTDAHRLAISTNSTTKSVSDEISGIIPRKSINEIGKLLSDSSEEVTLSLGSNTIMLKTDSTSFVSKLIEGKFPNYEQVLPSGESSVLSVNTKQLSEILSRVSVLSSDKFKGIKLNIKSKEVLVSANNPEQEEGEESFKTNYSGEDMEIAFNVNYIQEVLSNIDSNDCNINLYGSDKSCLISPSDDPDLKYVVMPLLI